MDCAKSDEPRNNVITKQNLFNIFFFFFFCQLYEIPKPKFYKTDYWNSASQSTLVTSLALLNMADQLYSDYVYKARPDQN